MFLTFQKNINMRQLFFESIRRWYVIVITLVVSILISFVYTKMFMTPLYSSTAKVMVFKKQKDLNKWVKNLKIKNIK